MNMVRWICGVKVQDRILRKELSKTPELDDIISVSKCGFITNVSIYFNWTQSLGRDCVFKRSLLSLVNLLNCRVDGWHFGILVSVIHSTAACATCTTML